MGSSSSKDGRMTPSFTLDEDGTDLVLQQSPQREPGPTKQAIKTIHKTVSIRDKEPSSDANALYENVFLVSLGSATGDGLPASRVFLPQLSKRLGDKPQLNKECIEEAVFERVLFKKPNESILGSPQRQSLSPENGNPEEPSPLRYLAQSYARLGVTQQNTKFQDMKEDLSKCKEVIFLNSKICLTQPELFPKQDMAQQFVDVCLENVVYLADKESKFCSFLTETISMLESKNGEKVIKKAFTPVLTVIKDWFIAHCLLTPNEISKFLAITKFFTSIPSLAALFIDFNDPIDWASGYCYEQTLLGSILSLSACPKSPDGPFEFFPQPLNNSPQQNNTTIMFIWQRMSDICEDVHRILVNIMKISPELKHKCLNWIAKCIEANREKPDLWSSHEAMVVDRNYCSDGFFLNFCYVMLKLCQPFAFVNGEKLLKVKPSYCRAEPSSDEERKNMAVHARGMSKETPFVPYNDDNTLDVEKNYHFICECFFLTHQALHIGFSVVPKILKLNNNINRLDRLYRDIQDVYHKSILKLVKDQLSKEMSIYRNLKASVTEYHLTKMCLNFHVASASWLVQVAVDDNFTKFSDIKLPLAEQVPKSLSYLPEYMMTNLNLYIACLELYKNTMMVIKDKESFEQIITIILIFMTDKNRLVNPDIRAQLAENLEAFIPKQLEDGTFESGGKEEEMFSKHPLIGHLAESLVSVFVSIEVRGQSVDSEKRFNYRKSMHRILQYIWKIPIHKDAIKKLAEKALTCIDSTEPPLFLRFINLLINDAIFLLDDALDYMKQIRQEEVERDSGKWSKLTPEEFRDKESGLRHLGMIGRYRNIIANTTMYTLEIITREIRTIFCHPIMVDRIAGMLNYFLDQLVGPKQKDYKVRDRKQFEFRPEQLVSDIAHIYLYLGKNEAFLKAVIEEKRSFSHSLFPQAENVLMKIGVVEQFILKFREFGQKVEGLQAKHKAQEEMMNEAPDDFLDPIMRTIMLDPVCLPTSSITVDRSVIARHLLSDQTDPFNRDPLSLDQVVPNTELRDKIQLWLTEQSNKSAEDNRSNTSAGDNRSNTSAGDNRSNTSAGDNRSNTSAGDRRSNTSTGDNRSNTSAGDRRSNTSAGDNRSSSVLSKQSRESVKSDKLSVQNVAIDNKVISQKAVPNREPLQDPSKSSEETT